MTIQELIQAAPWREAVTYRDTWPHEYVLSIKDQQEELFQAVCTRMCQGEGTTCYFFKTEHTYLFIGDYKYWFMTPCHEIPKPTNIDYVLNRAKLYRDRRDFVIRDGDTHRALGE